MAFVTVKLNIEQDTSWPIVWRVVAALQTPPVVTTGMTAAEKKAMVAAHAKTCLLRDIRHQIAREETQTADGNTATRTAALSIEDGG